MFFLKLFYLYFNINLLVLILRSFNYIKIFSNTLKGFLFLKKNKIDQKKKINKFDFIFFFFLQKFQIFVLPKFEIPKIVLPKIPIFAMASSVWE